MIKENLMFHKVTIKDMIKTYEEIDPVYFRRGDCYIKDGDKDHEFMVEGIDPEEPKAFWFISLSPGRPGGVEFIKEKKGPSEFDENDPRSTL